METMQTLEREEQDWMEKVYQGYEMPEFTAKVIVVGALLGALAMASNVYMGLKIGFTEGGSILSAILCFAIIRALRGKLSVLENNIAQTVASAAASIGIMVSVMPALILLGYTLTKLEIFFWVLFVGLLGVFFAIPLRKQLVVIEKLTFPTGTACATTIRAMHAHGEDALKKARALGITGLVSGIITWFRDATPAIIPPITSLPGKIGGFGFGQLTLGINWSPMLFGVGFLIGPRIGISLLLGATLAWGILAPLLANAHVIEGISYREITHWTMWLAIALMVSAGFTSMAMKGRLIVRAFQSMRGAKYSGKDRIEFPFQLWLPGILIAAVSVALIMQFALQIPVWMGLLAIVLSFVFATVAIRAYGETDINPVGTMGHSTQILYGALAPGKTLTNLMAGGVTAGCADTAADMMQDLKTGYLLGATPRKQTYAQFLGVVVGAVVAVLIFLVVTEAYGVATEIMPAPAAVLWSGMAKVLSEGISALPEYTLVGVLGGAILGILLTILENTKWGQFIPSPYAMGIAVVVPAFFSLSMFLGSMVKLLLKKRFPKWIETYSTPIAAGGIAGEATIGVLIAILIVSGLL